MINAGVVFLIRHAHAGSRSGWRGPDDLRPLTEKGRAQAAQLTRSLQSRGICRVVSSPSRRCVQTVIALAEHLGVTVEESSRVREGASADAVAEFLKGFESGPVAICTHGDVIGAVLRRLREAGGEIPDEPRFAKASIWLLDLGAGGPGRTTAKYLPPPG